MTRKKKAAGKKKRVVVSEKQRAEDDKLREALRNADLGKFDKALGKALKAQPSN